MVAWKKTNTTKTAERKATFSFWIANKFKLTTERRVHVPFIGEAENDSDDTKYARVLEVRQKKCFEKVSHENRVLSYKLLNL